MIDIDVGALNLDEFHPGARETIAALAAMARAKPTRAQLRDALDEYAKWTANDLPEAEPHAALARERIERLVFGDGA